MFMSLWVLILHMAVLLPHLATSTYSALVNPALIFYRSSCMMGKWCDLDLLHSRWTSVSIMLAPGSLLDVEWNFSQEGDSIFSSILNRNTHKRKTFGGYSYVIINLFIIWSCLCLEETITVLILDYDVICFVYCFFMASHIVLFLKKHGKN